MFRNYLVAALRQLARSPTHSAISVLGLAMGICVALLVALVLRNQYGYDRFIEGYDRVYLAVATLIPAQRELDYNPASHSAIAAHLELRFPEVEAATRLAEGDLVLQHGDIQAREAVYWADPDFFDVMPMPVVAGDLAQALHRPDGLVLPRALARKYFGRDAPLGETLRVGGDRLMTVRAVIEDLPFRATELRSGVFLSGLAPGSELARLDADPANGISPEKEGFFLSVYTYVRLVPGASVERLQASMQSLVQSLWVKRPPGLGASVTLVRLDRVHLFPGFNPGAHGRLLVSLAAGLVILFVAGINFVNLSTARASRRAREVMVRKVAGASRGALILQFLGESFVYVVLATSMALALTELLLPSVNAFVKGGATFDVVSDPVLIAWIGCGVVLLSVVAGLYPAFVLSSFRPVGVLRGLPVSSRGAGLTRQVLVTLQFAVLISLIVCATVMYQQREFATSDALRVSTDQHLIIRSECREALKNELKELAGVRSVGCATPSFVTSDSFANVRLFDGTETAVGVASIDAGMLEQYGLVPVAGRFFSAEDSGAAANVLINEAAVRRYGFASPQAAIGQSLPEAGPSAQVTRVIGVVPDFSLHSVEREIPPTVYYGAGRSGPFRSLIDVKLTGERIPETLTAIQRVWKSAGESQPPQLLFLDDYIQGLYQTMLQFAQAFAVMSALAVVLACLGLVGLSVSTTERRRKEIGIRKAMGASVSNVLRLLAWQFTKPVLWAMLIAWPVSAGLMHRWLEGFAYHVPLTPWPFLAAGALALGVAWVTVSVQSYSVARSPPTRALRYE